MGPRTNRQWRLASRPVGMITPANFRFAEETVAPLREGEVLVRNRYLSLDPTNRVWASDVPSYLPPVELGSVMRGGALGVVEESRNPRRKAGDLVQGLFGWQEYAVTDGQCAVPERPFPTGRGATASGRPWSPERPADNSRGDRDRRAARGWTRM